MPLAALDLGLEGWILVALGGGVLALDGTAWPQAMVSRPVVAATLGGLLFGGTEEAFLVGAILEFLDLAYPPFGAARHPEAGPAALLAGAGHALAGVSGVGGLAAAAFVGWGAAWIAARTVRWQWAWNGRLVADADALAAAPRQLERRHRWGMRLAFLRGAVVTGALLLPVTALVGALGGVRAAGPAAPAGVLSVAAAVALAAGAGSRVLGAGRAHGLLVAAGALAAWALGFGA